MSARDRPPSYISTRARVRGRWRGKRKGAAPSESRVRASLSVCIYLKHYTAWERKSIELSAVNAFSPATVPTPGCSRQMLQIKQEGRERGTGGQETYTLTGRRKAEARLRG